MYAVLKLFHLSNHLIPWSKPPFLETCLPCMEPKSPLLCLQGHIIGPYRGSDETNPTSIITFTNSFNIIFPSTP
jgi:hypothetical protein